MPPRHIAELLAELERSVRLEERAMTSHDQQEAGAHTETVRLALRAALVEKRSHTLTTEDWSA
jgi:hypothetical protein